MTLSTTDLYARARTMSRDVEDNFLELGSALRQLKDRDEARFHDVWKSTDLGRRKAYYLVEISRVYEPLPIPRSRLKKIGWTKLQLVAKRVNRSNWPEVLHLTETTTTKQLERIVRGGKPVNNAHCVLMYFTPTQYKALEKALLQHGGEASGRGIVGKEAALMKLIEGGKDDKKAA